MHVKKDVKTELTPEMRAQVGVRIAQHTIRYDELEAEKKERTKDLSAKMKDERREWTRLAKAMRTGFLDEVVECEEVSDFDRNTVFIRRLDTGETVGERAMSGAERQTQMDLGEEKSAAPVVDITKGRRKRVAKGADDGEPN